jgi:hypothetical protein
LNPQSQLKQASLCRRLRQFEILWPLDQVQ